MAKCDPQTFPNFTAECIERLLVEVRSQAGDQAVPSLEQASSGTASKAGFDIHWQYDKDTLTLVVQCTGAPFYAPCGVINSQIQRWVSACYAAPPATQSPA